MIEMRGEEVGGVVSRLDITELDTDDTPENFTRRVVTAARDAEDKLNLAVWDIPVKGNPVLRGGTAQGSVQEVAIVSGNKNQILTAMRDSQGELRLITWTISANGRTITRAFTEEPKIPIQTVDVGIVGDRFHTACRDEEGRLSVAEWELGRDGNMRHAQSLTPGHDFDDVTEISITDGFTVSSIVAMRNSEGKLRTLNWTSEPFRRGGMGEGGEISRAALGHSGGRPEWITAVALPGPTGVRTGIAGGGRLLVDAGPLKLIGWKWGSEKSERDHPERFAETTLSGTDALALEVAAIGNLGALHDVYVTAHRGFGSFRKLLAKDRGKPRLTFNAWRASHHTKEIEHLGEVTDDGTF